MGGVNNKHGIANPQFMLFAYLCSGQIFYPRQDRDTCPTASEAYQENKFDIPIGPLWVQGESLEPCPESTLDLRSLSDIRNCLRHPQPPGPSATPGSLSDIRNCQVPVQPHLSGIIRPDIQLGRNHPTSRKP